MDFPWSTYKQSRKGSGCSWNWQLHDMKVEWYKVLRAGGEIFCLAVLARISLVLLSTPNSTAPQALLLLTKEH